MLQNFKRKADWNTRHNINMECQSMESHWSNDGRRYKYQRQNTWRSKHHFQVQQTTTVLRQGRLQANALLGVWNPDDEQALRRRLHSTDSTTHRRHVYTIY
eukprot:5084771-Amphidinium_carterae.1